MKLRPEWLYPSGQLSRECGAWGRSRAWVEVGLSNLNLPEAWAEWTWDENDRLVGFWTSLGWGNGNSDPVWSVGFELRFPAWLMRLLARFFR